MDDGNEKQGISREGPLRSITSPPFSGPMAFRNSEPLAHTHVAARTPLPPPPEHNSSPVLPPSSSASPPLGGAPIPAPTAAPYQATQQSPPTHPLEYTSQDHYQSSSGGAFTDGQQQQHAQAPATAHDLFAHPPPQAATPLADPLSHLLRDGMQMERDGTPPASASQDGGHMQTSTGVEYGRQPVVAQTQPPPAAPEPTLAGWGSPARAAGGGAGGNRDSFRERDSASPSSPPMPALPPPPTNYAASGKHYQQQQLQRLTQSPPGTTSPSPPPVASTAGVHFPVPPPAPSQQKTIDELVSEFLSSSAPAPPEPTDHDAALGDPDGWVAALGRLARRRAWGTMVEVAGTMIVAHRGGGAPRLTVGQAMDVRLRRVAGLLRLGRTTDAAEAAVEAREEAGQPPLAAVSIAARLASAGAKTLCGGVAEEEALDELAELRFELEEFSSNPQPSPSTEADGAPALTKGEAAAWRRRVVSSLANAFVGQGNWRLALGLLEAMGEEECSSAVAERGQGVGVDGSCCGEDGVSTTAAAAAEVAALRVELLSRIGRVFLQLGALKDAEVYFRRAAEAVEEREDGDGEDDPRILVNRGLLLFSKNEFVAAQESFQGAAGLAAKSAPPRQTDDGLLGVATLDEGAGLLDSALNNLSLAMVYSCDVMRGVQTLEGLIRNDPRLYMLDVVVFNLCTLYDLSFDAASSARKKCTLQAIAQRFLLEDIDPASFRIG